MLTFFPRDVLNEIWDLIGSVSEGFPTYFCKVVFGDTVVEMAQWGMPMLAS